MHKGLKKVPTSGNYKGIVQVVYDVVKRKNKWMGGREWHTWRYIRGFQKGTEDRGKPLYAREG